MTYLFLDDIRMPEQVGNYMIPVDLRPMYRIEKWQIVRNYKEFTEWILANGLPDVVSFDHDLAEAHYCPDTWTESFKHLEETGYDCAKWLADFCAHEHLPLPIYYIHSMNPVGSENIRCYLENYKKHSDDKEDTSHRASTTSKEAGDSI